MTAEKSRGRPETPAHLKRDQCNFRLPRWLIGWLGAQPNGKGKTIESALVRAYKLKPPKPEDA